MVNRLGGLVLSWSRMEPEKSSFSSSYNADPPQSTRRRKSSIALRRNDDDPLQTLANNHDHMATQRYHHCLVGMTTNFHNVDLFGLRLGLLHSKVRLPRSLEDVLMPTSFRQHFALSPTTKERLIVQHHRLPFVIQLRSAIPTRSFRLVEHQGMKSSHGKAHHPHRIRRHN